MHRPHAIRIVHLIVIYLVGSLPLPAWAQVHPTLDPDISPYVYQKPASGKLAVSASNKMKPLLKIWMDELAFRHPGLKVHVVSERSEMDLSALLEHRTDIALLPRRITTTEIGEFVKEYGFEPTEVPVATDALAVFVHKSNPITGLSLDELDAIFCQDRRRGFLYSIDSWGLLGLDDQWFEAPVHTYGLNRKSGTSSLFREEVCKGGPLSSQLTDAPGSASVLLELETDEYGIGLSSIGYRTSDVKPIQIASVKGGRYVEPSFDSLRDGSYPLRRTIYLYIAKPPKASPMPATAELIRFALSQQGQQLAIDLEYFPLSGREVARVVSKWSPSVTAAKVEKPGRPIPD